MLDLSLGSPRYAINRVIFDLSQRSDARALIAHKPAFLAGYELTLEARTALLGPDWSRLLELGVLPNLVYRYYTMHGLAPGRFSAAIAASQ